MTSLKMAQKMQTVNEKSQKKSPLKAQDTQDYELPSANANSQSQIW